MTHSRRRLIKVYLIASALCAAYVIWAGYRAPTIEPEWQRRRMVIVDGGTPCPRPCHFPQMEEDR